jgi:hypothetical protein
LDKFDRTLQREILQALYDAYPNQLPDEIPQQIEQKFHDRDTFTANLLYLQEHGLIKSATLKTADALFHPTLFIAKITQDGIDFVRDDGGLGADLKAQVIKFHDSTIVALEDILLLSNLPEEEKQGALAKLRSLPEDAIKHLTLQLLTKAALNAPAVLHIFQTALHH